MTSLVELQNYINGKFIPSKKFIDSYNPSNGQVWAKVPDSGKSEVDEAVKAAKIAFKTWSKTSIQDRAKILFRIADLMEENNDLLAEVESRDQGKPETFAKTQDIPASIDNFRHFASGIPHILGEAKVSGANEYLNYTTNSPIGVAGLITPWNFPMLMVTLKVSAAIACGNTVVLKPSEMTSASAYEFCKLIHKAGVPTGVINIVYGYGTTVGEAIINHPDISLISFTGSTVTGTRIASVAGPMHKRVGLEMGGKNPSIVFADCDMKQAISTHILSSFLNQGQVCISSSRIFVQREIYDNFLSEFIKETNKLKVGPATGKDVFMGPMNSKAHMQKVEHYLQQAIKDGGKIECGETIRKLEVPDSCKNGYYILPTIITGLKDSSKVMTDEIFGPVTCVMPFDTETEVIERANNTKYGLSATVWTGNSGRAQRVANQLQAGTVWINSWFARDVDFPFGGFKCSGAGREGTYDSYEFYTEKKTICTSLLV